MIYKELIEKEKELKEFNKKKKILVPTLIMVSLISLILVLFFYANLYDDILIIIFAILFIVTFAIWPIILITYNDQYKYLAHNIENSIIDELGIKKWKYLEFVDDIVYVKSSQSVYNFTDIKYFKDNHGTLNNVENVLNNKNAYRKKLTDFIKDNQYKNFMAYPEIEERIKNNIKTAKNYNIIVSYTSPAGRSSSSSEVVITNQRLNQFLEDKSLLMSKTEYNKYLKDNERILLEQKKHQLYEKINIIIDKANKKENIIIKKDIDKLDLIIGSVFDKAVSTIAKIKSIYSEEWEVIDKIITEKNNDIDEILSLNSRIVEYYESPQFKHIKESCNNLMNSQIEFNEYIDEKVKSITELFGTRVVRNETIYNDEYNYVHTYKKSISPFTAELSATVMGSAENNTLDYVIKCFYPNKERYPEQIEKLHLLIEELETLKDAKKIIENNKQEIKEYLNSVPNYVLDNDESGFYSKLGFANVDESSLVVEYTFSYTSNAGRSQKQFTVPMAEETIIELINSLESKLTFTAFSKEQRALMTSKLRTYILERDNYTCANCHNSTKIEPNLLLEIDHKIPISKGGLTVENNLQTLCWKCNRHKGSKII